MRPTPQPRLLALALALLSLPASALAQDAPPSKKPEMAPEAPAPGLAYAPPQTEIDGLLATPIDVLGVKAKAEFDLETVHANVLATMDFRMLATGMPVFDLRQDIERAWLDGQEVDPATMAAHDFGLGASTMRILEQELKAGSRHQLRFSYPLRQPQSRESDPIGWGDENTLTWDFFFSDLNPGRYLEMWFPSNLIYDQFPFTLDLALLHAGAPHLLITNGAAEEKGEHHWLIRFPEHFTPLSQLLTVVPAADVDTGRQKFKTSDGQEITIEATVRHDAGTTVKQALKATQAAIESFTESTGPWAHGPRCVVYVWPGSRSMEYDGGTTTAMGALEHELFHSWYARGVKPANQNAGWLDEAWDMINTSGNPLAGREIQEGRPRRLALPNPWNRTTPGQSYTAGAAFFGRLMARVGEQPFRELMAKFYREHALQVVSTEDLRDFLIAETGDEGISQMFARYIFGEDVAVPSKP